MITIVFPGLIKLKYSTRIAKMQLHFQNSWRGIAIDALQMKLVLQSFEIEFD